MWLKQICIIIRTPGSKNLHPFVWIAPSLLENLAKFRFFDSFENFCCLQALVGRNLFKFTGVRSNHVVEAYQKMEWWHWWEPIENGGFNVVNNDSQCPETHREQRSNLTARQLRFRICNTKMRWKVNDWCILMIDDSDRSAFKLSNLTSGGAKRKRFFEKFDDNVRMADDVG
jgi:hypothetical protein